jgi:uncharacterized membrane protein
MVMNLGVPLCMGDFFTTSWSVSFSRRTLVHGVIYGYVLSLSLYIYGSAIYNCALTFTCLHCPHLYSTNGVSSLYLKPPSLNLNDLHHLHNIIFNTSFSRCGCSNLITRYWKSADFK